MTHCIRCGDVIEGKAAIRTLNTGSSMTDGVAISYCGDQFLHEDCAKRYDREELNGMLVRAAVVVVIIICFKVFL